MGIIACCRMGYIRGLLYRYALYFAGWMTLQAASAVWVYIAQALKTNLNVCYASETARLSWVDFMQHLLV